MPDMFLVVVNVKDTNGTTAKPNIRVFLRNNNTNELMQNNTDATGQVAFQLANLASGWRRGDIVTVFVIYEIYEAYYSYTTPATGGGKTISLTLETAATSEELRYFTPQDFLDFFNFKLYEDDTERGIKVEQIIKIGRGVERDIDERTGSVWDDNNESYYTATNEYHNFRDAYDYDVFLDKRPVHAITTVQVNTVSDGSTESWQTLTATTDYEVADADTGYLRLHETTYQASSGVRQVRVTYTYGTTVPEDIKRLAILMTGRSFLTGGVIKNLALGHSEVNVINNLSILDTEINDILYNRTLISAKNT